MPRQTTEQTNFARQLRREPTQFKRNLWKLLRDHQLEGYHFRRQQPVGPYVADFACIKAKLIVELDGNSHDELVEHDARRDADLQAMGWRVLRISNVYLRDHPKELWDQIERELLREV